MAEVIIQFDRYEFRPATGEIRDGTKCLGSLPRGPATVLHVILDKCAEGATFYDFMRALKVTTTDNAMHQHLSSIRNLLGDDGKDLLKCRDKTVTLKGGCERVKSLPRGGLDHEELKRLKPLLEEYCTRRFQTFERSFEDRLNELVWTKLKDDMVYVLPGIFVELWSASKLRPNVESLPGFAKLALSAAGVDVKQIAKFFSQTPEEIQDSIRPSVPI